MYEVMIREEPNEEEELRTSAVAFDREPSPRPTEQRGTIFVPGDEQSRGNTQESTSLQRMNGSG